MFGTPKLHLDFYSLIRIASGTQPTASDTMATTYRVEAHDGKRWSFGIRMNDISGMPEFCCIPLADRFNTRAKALRLRDQASRLWWQFPRCKRP